MIIFKFLFDSEVVSFKGGEAQIKEGQCISYKQGFLCTNAFAADLHEASKVKAVRGQIIVSSPCNIESLTTLGYINKGFDYFKVVDGRLLIGGEA